MSAHPRIALIHATPAAIEPTRRALESGWPAAEAANILDDSLSSDRARSAELTEPLTQRIVDLARYARRSGARGILFTCSAFGGAIDRAAAALDVPVLKPNEAMFDAALARYGNPTMILTFPPSGAALEAEFLAAAHRLGSGARIRSELVPSAMDALRCGDAEAHHRLIAERAQALTRGSTGCDAILLPQFSSDAAAPAVRALVGIPVLTSPEAAVAKLRQMLG